MSRRARDRPSDTPRGDSLAARRGAGLGQQHVRGGEPGAVFAQLDDLSRRGTRRRGSTPFLAGPTPPVTLANAGAPHATLVAIIVVFIAAALLVGPSFALLFTMQSRRLLGAGEPGTLPAAVATGHTGQSPAQHQRPPPDQHP
jgi:hypothetical protein